MIIIANSLTFYLGNLEGFQAQIYEFLILFSTYPEGLFDGSSRYFFSVLFRQVCQLFAYVCFEEFYLGWPSSLSDFWSLLFAFSILYFPPGTQAI